METGHTIIISGIRPLHAGISPSPHGSLESTVAHAWMVNCIGLYGLRGRLLQYTCIQVIYKANSIP